MSFLFKSSKKAGPGTTPNTPLPPASRDIRSSDGPSAPPSSQIPTLNGVPGISSKPGSPTYGQSVNASISSIAEKEPTTSLPPPVDERVANLREDGTRSTATPSPEQKSLREHSRETSHETPQTLPVPTRPSGEASPYPWSQKRINFTVSHTNPFPRYGAAVNSTATKDGSIYLMGGLINGSTVKGDLWMVEANSPSLTSFPVATTSEGPGPRVGHASLLVGNAFIVFGGDTKMDEGDMLDDTLYLLNTSTKQWSRALPAGPRPPGRYGHTLNILGSKIYIFGGQVEGYFFNDLVAFDLNALQQSNNRWEILIQNTIDGGPPHGQIPPARTNHTMVTWGDRLYLFGGTDGVHWFNDVWSYSPHTNSWTQLECIGYIPSPREGHAASLVGDVMYIFGGRNEEGNDLGDLAAFRISSRRWYTFQNMGPSPSPRSGHSMTSVGKQIVVLAGEPSSAPRDPVELGLAYFLDTSKIRYPPDSASQQPSNERVQGTRRPSGERVPGSQTRSPISRDTMERSGSASGNGDGRTRTPDGSRLPRAQPQLPAPFGPPPRAPMQPNGVTSSRQPTRAPGGAFGGSNENDHPQPYESNSTINGVARDAMTTRSVPTSPRANDDLYDTEEQSEQRIMAKPETYQPSQVSAPESYQRSNSRALPENERVEETPRPSEEAHQEQTSTARKISEDTYGPQDSGIGSSPAFNQQHDSSSIAQELDQARRQNAWYASELALARKAGYQARSTTDSPVFDEQGKDSFGDDDRPLVEALLKMRAELAKVQDTIEEHSKSAMERIADVERQRDAAVSEAVFAKARFAAQSGGSPQIGRDSPLDRSNDISRRLASSLEAQNELSKRINILQGQLESEKKARSTAEDTAEAAEKRVTELNGYRQEHSADVESLRNDLHEARKEARNASANHAEILTQHRLLTVDKDDLSRQLETVSSDSETHRSALVSLRDALTASTDKADLLERHLDEERGHKGELERSLRDLRVQHEERTIELHGATRRLRDVEELAQKHEQEARTHREAVAAGLGRISERGIDPSNVNDDRVAILQQQVQSAHSMVRQNQEAADAASEKLRRAEERIAGLEAYQEQASREGLSIRKQLQTTMKENQNLGTDKSDLEQRLERHMLETNALSVQHASLKDILGERGISALDKRRSRAVDSPSTARFGTPDQSRIRELEQQLDTTMKGHEDMKMQYGEVSARSDKMQHEYEEKLTALDNDHQAAVKYLRGTEKMLSKMKQELQRVKNENGDLKKKIDKVRDDADANMSSSKSRRTSAEWVAERDQLREEFANTQASLQGTVANLEHRVQAMQDRLQYTENELQHTKSSHTAAQNDLTSLHTSFSQSRDDIERLQKDNSSLEQRAQDAENKVQLLLDQVESSVDNYRRRSRLSTGPPPNMNGAALEREQSASEASEFTNHVRGHSRNVSNMSGMSVGGESNHSGGAAGSAAGDDGRNSLALDSLASELETLRSHWETTNKHYRLSDRFEFERTQPTTNAASTGTSSLAAWRRGLDIDDEDSATEQYHGQAGTTNTGRPMSKDESQIPTPTMAQSTPMASGSR